jgi:phosphohistidine phosphatase
MAALRLYFLRHGKALSRDEWREDDGLRPLTEQGEKEVRAIGSRLVAMGLRPESIVSSPLARARRTAELVAEALDMTGDLLVDERLAPGFDRAALAGVVADRGPAGSLMVVGHEPDFSETIGELTGGRVVCKKAGLARVDVDGPDLGGGRLVWLLPPGLLAGG